MTSTNTDRPTWLYDSTCPPWCTLEPGHAVDSLHDDGRQSRGHEGPTFGAHLTVSSVEFTDAPGVHVPFVYLHGEEPEDFDAIGLMLHARNALEAAAWLEVERDKASVASLATARAGVWLGVQR